HDRRRVDRSLRERLEDVLQQREHDQGSLTLVQQSEKLLESHVDIFLVQKCRAHRKGTPDGGGLFPSERSYGAPAWVCGGHLAGAFLETGQRDHFAADHLGKVSKRNGRSLAANAKEKRDGSSLAGATPKDSSRYLAGSENRGHP